MRFRFVKTRPSIVKYTRGRIHFRCEILGDFRWHLIAMKGDPPRKDNAPVFDYVDICDAREITDLWQVEARGFEAKTYAAEMIMKRLVRDGYAERIDVPRNAAKLPA